MVLEGARACNQNAMKKRKTTWLCPNAGQKMQKVVSEFVMSRKEEGRLRVKMKVEMARRAGGWATRDVSGTRRR